MYRSKVHLTVGSQNIKPNEVFECKEEEIVSALERGLVEVILEGVEVKKELPELTDNSILEEEVAEIINNVDIESLNLQYEEKFGKPVSNRYKNDPEYITNKLNS